MRTLLPINNFFKMFNEVITASQWMHTFIVSPFISFRDFCAQKIQKIMLLMMNNKNIFDLRQYLLFPQHEIYLLNLYFSLTYCLFKHVQNWRCSVGVQLSIRCKVLLTQHNGAASIVLKTLITYMLLSRWYPFKTAKVNLLIRDFILTVFAYYFVNKYHHCCFFVL